MVLLIFYEKRKFKVRNIDCQSDMFLIQINSVYGSDIQFRNPRQHDKSTKKPKRLTLYLHNKI